MREGSLGNAKDVRDEVSRRQFISIAGSVATLGSLHIARATEANSVTDFFEPDAASLRALFLNPPLAARPLTRWWWFGAAVTPEEITRELISMRDAGLGGVELQPVYPLAVDDPQRGIVNTPYFSERWFDLVRHAARETQRLELLFDFTLGSGWPYGGPMIPLELSARRLRVVRQDVEGPRHCSFQFLQGELTEGDNAVCAVAAPVLPSGELDLSGSKVVARTQSVNRLFFPSGWEAPAGRWRLMLFIDSPTRMQVKRPTIGMEGYVLDYFNAEAVSLFLKAVGNRTFRELKTSGTHPIHSVFSDSLEVYGADWTPAMLAEFERRRGYDLSTYLPALWENAGPETVHVRYDYHLTLSELILDGFFRTLISWAERNGTTTRIQAHGAMGDVMRGYGLAHIPEGENYGRSDRYNVNLKHRRLATSAGHIYNRPVISSETYTWLREQLFLVTLEMMKGATDAAFLDGINQIVNHGYPSSPAGAGLPGWTFYAPTVVNRNNTWWPHYVYLATYIRRTAALLRQGTPVNPVAVYLPMADVYAKFGCGSLNMDEAIENHLGLGLFNEIRRAGYDFDVLNDHALTELAKIHGGVLHAGMAEYRVIIVPPCTLIPPESLARIKEFALNGGSVIFIERVPKMAPGMFEQNARTAKVNELLRELIGSGNVSLNHMKESGNGRVVIASPRASVLRHLNDCIQPDFTVVECNSNSDSELQSARENIGFVHRRLKFGDLYFISNISDGNYRLRSRFACGHKNPELWNAETGEIQKTIAFDYSRAGNVDMTEIEVNLGPFESRLAFFGSATYAPSVTRANLTALRTVKPTSEGVVVTGDVAENGDYFITLASGKTKRFSVSDMHPPVSIQGPWKLQLGGSSLTLERLRSWAELPAGERYSGWATYETAFWMEMLRDEMTWTIELGAVHETAEVEMNGHPLGATWKGVRRLPMSAPLKQGRNLLRIKVANLWIQAVSHEPPVNREAVVETYGARWGEPETPNITKLPPSGLLGPVRLVATKRVTESVA